MVTEEEAIRLALQVTGQVELDDLNKRAKALEKQMKDVAVALKTTDAAQLNANVAFRAAVSEYSKVQKEIIKAEAAMEKLNAAQGKAAGSSRNMGQSLLQIGRGVQDFQAAGIMGITNNIEGLAQALGLGAGLAGGLTLAAVGLQLALPHIKAFLESLRPEVVKTFSGRVEELGDRIKTLEAKPVKLSVDMREIEAAKREIAALTKAKEAFDSLMGKQTRLEAASGQALQQMLTETPGARDALDLAKRRRGAESVATDEAAGNARARTMEIEGRIADLKATKPEGEEAGEAYYATLRNLQHDLEAAKAIEDAAVEKARKGGEAAIEKLVQTATDGRGENQRKAQGWLAHILAGEGRGDVARQITGATDAQGRPIGGLTVAAMARDEGAEEDFKRAEESGKEISAARKAAIANRDRQEKEVEKDAAAFARDLQERYNKSVFAGRAIDQGDIEAELKRSGADAALAPAVLAILDKTLKDAASQLQRQEGLPTAEAALKALADAGAAPQAKAGPRSARPAAGAGAPSGGEAGVGGGPLAGESPEVREGWLALSRNALDLVNGRERAVTHDQVFGDGRAPRAINARQFRAMQMGISPEVLDQIDTRMRANAAGKIALGLDASRLSAEATRADDQQRAKDAAAREVIDSNEGLSAAIERLGTRIVRLEETGLGLRIG